MVPGEFDLRAMCAGMAAHELAAIVRVLESIPRDNGVLVSVALDELVARAMAFDDAAGRGC